MRNFTTFLEIKNYINNEYSLTISQADALVDILSKQPEFISDLEKDSEMRHIFSGANFEKVGKYAFTFFSAGFVILGAVPTTDNPRRYSLHQSPSRSKDLISRLYSQLQNNENDIQKLCKGILILSTFEGCDDFLKMEDPIFLVLKKLDFNEDKDTLSDYFKKLSDKLKISFHDIDKVQNLIDAIEKFVSTKKGEQTSSSEQELLVLNY